MTRAASFWVLPALLLSLSATGVVVGSCTDISGNVDGDDDGTDGEPPRYAGSATCAGCHAETYSRWRLTEHADALETLKAIGQEENENCLGCHVVGFGEEDGFVDEASTPQLAGVQCETCHGPAAQHAANPSDAELHPTIDLSADLCGGCHNDAHHPTFEEWELSKHAAALTNLADSGFGSDQCLECHSEDYRWAEEHAAEGHEVEIPTIETAELAITCSTCHSAHAETFTTAQLRKPVAELCGQCHTSEESSLGDTPHHPQVEMLRGEGALAADGTDLEAVGPHSGLVFEEGGEACAQCHVIRHEVEEPNEAQPNVTGHTFNPFDAEIVDYQPEDRYAGCRLCHSISDAEMLKDGVQTEIEARLTNLAGYFDEEGPDFIDPDSLSDADKLRLSLAKFDFQFVGADGSTGVHNSTYARAALEIAETITADLAP